ncbi:MAG: hypothetical protein WDM88_02625 [Galbitalea sp.]
MTARTEQELTGPLARLVDEGMVEVFEVRGLGLSTAGKLVENALGGTVEPASLRRLVSTADGNPLFLRELLMASVERNTHHDQREGTAHRQHGPAGRTPRQHLAALRGASASAAHGRRAHRGRPALVGGRARRGGPRSPVSSISASSTAQARARCISPTRSSRRCSSPA